MGPCTIDPERGLVTVRDNGVEKSFSLESPEAFEIVSRYWLRCGWDVKHVYSFTWLGRPVIQLPEDLIRVQEVIYQVKPTVILETGVAHGGSSVFFASLCRLMGRGRVVAVDITIRPHNRQAIEEHDLSPYITLIEGSSIDPEIVGKVRSEIREDDVVFALLDSNHTKDHVLSELRAYAPMVTAGSYIVVADGIAADVVGAPRTKPNWAWNNPISAIDEFLRETQDFESVEPRFPFNESLISRQVTYWPRGYLRRIR